MPKYADIIVAVEHKDLDRVFTYKIPKDYEDKISIGMRAIVPFGKGNKNTEAYIIGFSDEINFSEKRLKDIIDLPDDKPMFTAEMIELAKWMNEKYFTPIASCLKLIMPAGIKIKTDYIITVINNEKSSEKANSIINYILNNNNKVTLTELEQEFSNINSVLLTLENKKIILKTQLTKVKDYIIRIKYVYLNYDLDNIDNIIEELSNKKTAQAKVINLLKDNNGMSLNDIKSLLHISNSPINTLEKNNIVIIEKVETRRNIATYTDDKYKKPDNLTTEQKNAFDILLSKIKNNDIKPVLLHGVTGSGKTEVYLQIIEEVIKINKQAIVLVPEITLTPQTVSRFTGRFSKKVTVTHSKLSLGERYDQWKKARDSEISIMIGPRSAIFTPFRNLGIIIIDEEHDKSYFSDTSPKFSTKEVALELSKLTGALVVLGSATPSIESYYSVKNGDFDIIDMKSRVNNTLPNINIVDMRKELQNGNRSIFSLALQEALKNALKKKQQIILFLNRRGHSTFISCRNCGYVMKCENCNVNYTYHDNYKRLICHYCGRREKIPKVCPVCASKYIKYFGIGTQKVENEIKRLFPTEKILRMDADTVSKKHSHEKILDTFRKGESSILIGTQMIAKGLDFPNVSLVGVIAADVSLNNSDFFSSENTYQLLMQVAGRAGRADIEGNVFIQTYEPEHYSIESVKENNYEEFYNHEIALRRMMDYPPFSKLFLVMFISKDESKISILLNKLADIMKYYNKKNQFDMIGPTPCIISKIKNKYQWKIIIRGFDEQKLKNFVLFCVDVLKNHENIDNVKINLTLNPVTIV